VTVCGCAPLKGRHTYNHIESHNAAETVTVDHDTIIDTMILFGSKGTWPFGLILLPKVEALPFHGFGILACQFDTLLSRLNP